MNVGLIWAQSRNGVIGKQGDLPWHLPEDLAHFKRVTHGHPVVMGRKTWESLPPRFKPLPGRPNWVVSSMQGPQAQTIEKLGARVVPTISAALMHCQAQHPKAGMVWVIGGAQLYRSAIDLADTLVVTHIEQEFAGDAWAPPIDAQQWQASQTSELRAASGAVLRFVTYQRRLHP